MGMKKGGGLGGRGAGIDERKSGHSIINDVPASQPTQLFGMEIDTVRTQKQRKSLLIEFNVGRMNIVATKFSN